MPRPTCAWRSASSASPTWSSSLAEGIQVGPEVKEKAVAAALATAQELKAAA
ncbi:MAG: hypothetical protein WDN45_16735 [Caulobacteraceae bacterium]